MTGNPIATSNEKVKVYQPTIDEIDLIGEELFFKSLNIFFIGTEPLVNFLRQIGEVGEEDIKKIAENSTSYDNLIFVMRATSSLEDQGEFVQMAKMFFKVVTPGFNFAFNSETATMLLISEDKSDSIVVDREFFEEIKSVANEVFLFETFFGGSRDKKDMCPEARRIAAKIEASERKLREMQGETDDESQVARILSIMGAGNELSYLKELTIYQLFNQFERMNLHTNHMQGFSAIVAGAKDIELVDWYKKI